MAGSSRRADERDHNDMMDINVMYVHFSESYARSDGRR
jgi:hypothetical protein